MFAKRNIKGISKVSKMLKKLTENDTYSANYHGTLQFLASCQRHYMDKTQKERQKQTSFYFSILHEDKVTTTLYLFRNNSGSIYDGKTCVQVREKRMFI
jgi:hypothetical protein